MHCLLTTVNYAANEPKLIIKFMKQNEQPWLLQPGVCVRVNSLNSYLINSSFRGSKNAKQWSQKKQVPTPLKFDEFG